MTAVPTIAELEPRAQAGDARAQYALAALLAGAGRAADAERWLNAAAGSGEPDALYTLATRELGSIAGVPKAAALLERARAGSVHATRLLAVLKAEGYGKDPDWSAASRSMMALAERGEPESMREIGALLLLADPADANGAALVANASTADALAAAVLAVRAATGRPNVSRGAAERAVRQLLAAGYPRADALGRALAAAPPIESQPRNPAWDDVADRLDAVLQWSPPTAETISSAPHARLHRAAFSPEILEYVIAHGALRLAPSTITGTGGVVRRDPHRTSMTATLGPADQDLVIVAVNRRLARLADIDHANGEFLSVLRYAPGEEYRAHYDLLAPEGKDFERGGQRVRTALLYLNDEYAGGETLFVASGLRVRGAPGDVLVFDSVLPDGKPDLTSRHAGLPVTAGVKWLASRWFRERPYRF
jgi:hypothetical protein